MTATAMSLLKVCDDQLYAIGQNSWSRPHTALDIAEPICNARPDVAWKFVMANWSGFDLIPHDGYRRLYARKIMRKWWRSPTLMPADAKQFYDRLPARLTIHRGQDASHDVGLSWTTDIDIAKRFTRGHRSSSNDNPVVLQSEVRKKYFAFITVDRRDSEIVLWQAPKEVVVVDQPADGCRMSTVGVPCGDCHKCCTGGESITLGEHDNPELYGIGNLQFVLIDGECHVALKWKPNGDCILLGANGRTVWPNHPFMCRHCDCRVHYLHLMAMSRPERKRWALEIASGNHGNAKKR